MPPKGAAGKLGQGLDTPFVEVFDQTSRRQRFPAALPRMGRNPPGAAPVRLSGDSPPVRASPAAPAARQRRAPRAGPPLPNPGAGGPCWPGDPFGPRRPLPAPWELRGRGGSAPPTPGPREGGAVPFPRPSARVPPFRWTPAPHPRSVRPRSARRPHPRAGPPDLGLPRGPDRLEGAVRAAWIHAPQAGRRRCAGAAPTAAASPGPTRRRRPHSVLSGSPEKLFWRSLGMYSSRCRRLSVSLIRLRAMTMRWTWLVPS
jgi:hypothetical protein